MAQATLMKLRRLKSFSNFCCFLGMVLSLFAFYVEVKKHQDESYVALCDINEKVSCSKVFTSKYGKGFGLLQFFLEEDSPLIQPNPVYGIIFYFINFLLGLGNYMFLAQIQFVMCILANCGSVYLGYILYFILQDMCIVCISTYVVNFMLLLSTISRKSNLKQLSIETGGPILFERNFKKRV